MNQDRNMNYYEDYSTRRSQMLTSTHRQKQQSTLRFIPCKFHPTNTLQTFCISPSCMLPMCHSCISLHNQDHYQSKNHGNYKDLLTLTKSTIDGIEQQRVILQQLSTEYVEDYNSKLQSLQKCRDYMNKSRLKLHEQIDRIFQKITINIQQKICNFNDIFHQMYNSLQQQIHTTYNILSKQKSILQLALQFDNNLYHTFSKFNKQSSQSYQKQQQQHNNNNNYTPGNTSLNYTIKQNQNRKQDRKILKTLIQYHANNQYGQNDKKISKLKKQISQLKLSNFDVRVDLKKISKIFNQVCNQCIKINDSMNEKDIIQNKNIKNGQIIGINRKNNLNNEKQANVYDSNTQINQIMRQTHQRLKKMQISSNQNNMKVQLSSNMGKDYKPSRM